VGCRGGAGRPEGLWGGAVISLIFLNLSEFAEALDAFISQRDLQPCLEGTYKSYLRVWQSKGTDRDKFVKDEYRRELDRNRRGIIIAFKSQNGYGHVLENRNCFSSENEDGGVYFAPELGVTISKGNLCVHYAHGRYGYWTDSFRYQSSDFELIGYDYSQNRGPVVERSVGINLVAKKMRIRENVNENAEGGTKDSRKVGRNLRSISNLLFAQLTSVSKHRTFNCFSVTDVIQNLEGVGRGSCVRGEEPFKHLPLKGFWKAHFFDARFLLKNLVNHWGLGYESSPKFSELCARVAEEEDQNPTVHGWQGRLAHEVAIDGYEEKAKKRNLTGEWLIFSKHENLSYYLCITRHSMTREGDEAIYALLNEFCEPEYPFLFSANAVLFHSAFE
jgi:hypothetical protein